MPLPLPLLHGSVGYGSGIAGSGDQVFDKWSYTSPLSVASLPLTLPVLFPASLYP